MISPRFSRRFTDRSTFLEDGGFSPGDLNLSAWYKLDVLARTAWNEANKQANDSTGNGNNGTIGSGVGLSLSSANSDWVSIPQMNPNDFTFCWWGKGSFSGVPIVFGSDTSPIRS